MPQLDVTTFPSQLFWLAVCFLALYVVLTYIAIPKISNILSERTQSIEGNLKEAEVLKTEAELLLNEYEKILADARIEARHRYMQVASDVSKKMARQQKDMIDKIAGRIREAEEEIIRAKVQTMKELSPTAVDVAQDILLNLTGHKFPKTTLKIYQAETN